MRLYVDEDIASQELIARLADMRHEVLPPSRGEPDARCWLHAQKQAAAVLTINAVDFTRLAGESPSPRGLLLVHRENDPTRDMTIAAVAAAISRVVDVYPEGVQGQILTLNQFRW